MLKSIARGAQFCTKATSGVSGLGMFAVALAVAPGNALAQDEEATDSFLEEIVVTASPRGVSKFETSLSVTTVSAERAESFVPQGAVDVLRTIPGIRAESSAGDSNGNITVRGVPLGGGGSKFLQLHEDGLPVLEFGDIIVGNADNYLAYDFTVDRVEAVKGGSAATLASNSPSGIVNFVTKTGKEQGGAFAFTTGLDFDQNRIDFDYGQPVGDDWAFHLGGFYRAGEGVRPTGFTANDGGQIRLSVERTLDNGSIRLYGKLLDDQTATILPMPVTAQNGELPGLDPRFASNIPATLVNNATNDASGGLRQSNIQDGNGTKSQVIGGKINFDIRENLVLNDHFRVAKNSGDFFGAFSVRVADAGDPRGFFGVGGPFENAITAPIINSATDALGWGYADGPGSTGPLSAAELSNLNGNGLLQEIRTFDNDIHSLDNFSNDLSLTFLFDDGDFTVGYYTSTQDLEIDWYWQTHIAEVSDEPRLLDLYSGDTRLTSNGQLAFGAPVWGNCCTRDTEMEAKVDAIYAAFNWEPSDSLSVNASIRYDEGEGRGSWVAGSPAAIDLDGDGVISFAESNAESIPVANRAGRAFSYDWSYVSFALGANYVINDSWAVFGNFSEGGRANFDRLADGGFIIEGQAQPNSVENTLRTFEVGVKNEGDNYGLFATAFYVETDDVNSESARGLETPARVREFESTGFELEVVANIGDFSIFGGLTYTDAEIVGSNDPGILGNEPRRQPGIVYSSTIAYNRDVHSFGLSFFGRDNSYIGDDNSLTLDSYTAFNLFANYYLSDKLSLRLAVNNLTDEIGLTEAEGGPPQTINGFDVIRARSITGRSTTLQLRYDF